MELNVYTCVGNLTRDPETRNAGQSQVCSFNIAINKRVKGESKPLFLDVKVWGKQAENCQQYLTKGAQVGITGELEPEEYTNREGVLIRKIVLVARSVSFGSRPQNSSNESQQSRSYAQSQPRASNQPETEDFLDQQSDDDLPF